MGLVLLPAARSARASNFASSSRGSTLPSALRCWLSGWTVGYVIANQIALAFVLIIAGNRAGVVSAYTYAFAFFQLPYGLVAVSIMTTLGPELASPRAAATRPACGAASRSVCAACSSSITPAAVGYFVLSRQIVVGLLEHGLFGHSDAVLAADTLAGFSVGLVPFSVYLYTLRGFYTLRDTKTPFIVNCLENALNIVFAAHPLSPLRHQRPRVRVLGRVRGVRAVVALAMLRARLGGLDGRRCRADRDQSGDRGHRSPIATALVAHEINEAWSRRSSRVSSARSSIWPCCRPLEPKRSGPRSTAVRRSR